MLHVLCYNNEMENELFVLFLCVQIGEISRPIILDWVIAQHGRILEWTGRAFDLEVGHVLSRIL